VSIVKVIRDRLGLNSAPERGLSLIEVMVAMLIFALISTGVLYTLISMISISRDSRARQVAVQLAAEEIDRARDVANVTELQPWDSSSGLADPNYTGRPAGPITINGDTFNVVRSVDWATDPDSVLKCGAGGTGEQVKYRRVNVRVTWGGMRSPSSSVQSDSLLNPRTAITDPDKGTLLISVLEGGVGAPGVTVTTTPAAAIAASPTDADGCTHFFLLSPGTYTVKLNKTGYVDVNNNPAPTETNVVITAGSASSRSYQYAKSGEYNLDLPSYAKPTNLGISFFNSDRTHVINRTASDRYDLYPAGYTIVAGDVGVCPAADPSQWLPGDDGSDPPVVLAPNSLPTYAADPGGDVDVTVPMGLIEVDGINPGRAIRAVSTTGSGHPACAGTLTYDFAAGEDEIALPFGSWTLYSRTGWSGYSLINESDIELDSYGKVVGGVVTLDPRTQVAP
jgi:prepilin-type N-terminal cleavage/methylation domain-containing protein